MKDGVAPEDDEPTARYEIRLQGTAPAMLRERFPTATVVSTRAETVLVRRFEEPAELDELIACLLAMGLVLTEVRELLVPVETSAVDEEPSNGRKEHRRGEQL